MNNVPTDLIYSFEEMDLNQEAHIFCLVLEAKTRWGSNGLPFIDAIVTSDGPAINAKVWKTTLEKTPLPEGKVVYAKVTTNMHNRKMTYVLSDIEVREDMDPTVVLPAAPIELGTAFDKMFLRAQGMRPPLSTLLTAILLEYREEFMDAAATPDGPYAMKGGLLYHACRMYEAAEALSSVYIGLDVDMAVAGAMMCEIGQLKALDTDWKGHSTYTSEGRLFGPAYLGARMIEAMASELKIADAEDVKVLAHIVASHYGEFEHGSVIAPATREAALVHHLQALDAEQELMDEYLLRNSCHEGEMTGGFGEFDYGVYVPKAPEKPPVDDEVPAVAADAVDDGGEKPPTTDEPAPEAEEPAGAQSNPAAGEGAAKAPASGDGDDASAAE